MERTHDEGPFFLMGCFSLNVSAVQNTFLITRVVLQLVLAVLCFVEIYVAAAVAMVLARQPFARDSSSAFLNLLSPVLPCDTR